MTVTLEEALSVKNHRNPRIIVETDPDWPCRATLMVSGTWRWFRNDTAGGCSPEDAVAILRSKSQKAAMVDQADVWVIAP